MSCNYLVKMLHPDMLRGGLPGVLGQSGNRDIDRRYAEDHYIDTIRRMTDLGAYALYPDSADTDLQQYYVVSDMMYRGFGFVETGVVEFVEKIT